MKKSIFIVAVLAAFTFASCKKDHVCECTVAGVSTKSTIKDTRKKAKEACEKGTNSFVTCKLN